MSERKRDWAEQTAFKIVPCVTGHDKGYWAICGNCVIRVKVVRALRRAEKLGYQRGIKELAKVLTGRQRGRRQERER